MRLLCRDLVAERSSSAVTSAHGRAAALFNYSLSGVGLIATAVVAFVALKHVQSGAATQVDYSKVFAGLLLFFAAGTNMSAARSRHRRGTGELLKRIGPANT
jgi:hypothetical protein